MPKMTFLDCLNSPKIDFTYNQTDGEMIKFQQSQALTSHFESFWSIVVCISEAVDFTEILSKNRESEILVFSHSAVFIYILISCLFTF